MALWIKADGTIESVHPKNGTDFQYEELREFVSGYIELVHPLGKSMSPIRTRYIVLNEEGKVHNLPLNEMATAIYNNPQDVIVGDVLICDSKEIK